MVFGEQEIDIVKDTALYVMRRKNLIMAVKARFPEVRSGIILLFAAFENGCTRFRQDSSFYYLTGIAEPGVVLTIDFEQRSTLYLPCFAKESRAKWIGSALSTTEEDAMKVGVDEIKELGQSCKGYKACPYVSHQEYELLLDLFVREQQKRGTIFTLCPEDSNAYCWQRLLLEHINLFVPRFGQLLVDISPIVESMRRRKDLHEIEQLYKAAEITMLAHEAAAGAIEPDANECEVQASLEYMITGVGAECAFPAIVASGKRSTILHYEDNNSVMKDGDLVVVDIGARYNHYCADITRTYPVSGRFTQRQREVYEIVLEAQEYIASIAKPGYWFSNKEQPDKSLNYLVKEFFKERGYEQYFLHGIGHFLGLDVHDLGDYKKSFQEGDVITIEPGIYIPQERLGIRIEDDYWVVKDGLICLSDALPKKVDDIEVLVQQQFLDGDSTFPHSSCDFMDEEIDA